MDDVLTTNLQRLTSPHLARRVEETGGSRAELVGDPDGPRGLRLSGMSLCSKVAPLREAENWARSVDLTDASYLVVFGLGMGYQIEALRRLVDVPITVMEPSLDVIHTVLGHRPLELAGVQIVDKPNEVRDLLAGSLGRGSLVKTLPWPPTRRLFADVFAATHEAVELGVAMAMVTNNTLEARLSTWVRGFIENLPSCVGCVPASALWGKYRGHPTIIVAAGPSLDLNVEQLAQAADRALVFGVNTAMGAIDDAGVAVDFIAAVEILDVSCQLAQLQVNRQTPRMLCTWANPALFALDDVALLPFAATNPYLDSVSAVAGFGPPVDPGGSVANSAFNIARMMGADPIVLVGQDLAYTSNRAYASGTVFDEIRIDVKDDLATLSNLETKRKIGGSVEGADTTRAQTDVVETAAWGRDGLVTTTKEFNYYRYKFEVYARNSSRRLINATEGGAHIDGFEELPLSTVLKQLPRRAPPALPTSPRIAADDVASALEPELAAAREVVRQCRVALAQGTDALDNLSGAIKLGKLVGAFCWATLQGIIQDDEATPSDLCRQVARDAESVSELIENTLKKI